jgi:hypothetical protein
MKARQFPPDFGKADGPGPGKYWPDYKKAMEGEGRSKTILERFKDKGRDKGVGYYDIRPEDKGPRWTIGQRDPLRIRPGCEI